VDDFLLCRAPHLQGDWVPFKLSGLPGYKVSTKKAQLCLQ
jgi:hypothetical protein